MSEVITVHKADPIVSDKPISGMIINIITTLPECNSLNEAQHIHNDDANKIFYAMKKNLPQGTKFRLAQLFIKESINLYRGV